MPIIFSKNTLEEIPSIVFSELKKGTARKKHPFKNVVLTTIPNQVIPHTHKLKSN